MNCIKENTNWRRESLIQISRMKKAILLIRLGLLVCFLACAGAPAFGATFTVNSTLDLQDSNPGDGGCRLGTLPPLCTLRGAITEANALPGDDVIVLPAGTYMITLSASGEDANAGGDFDVISNITINGAGAGSTIIQAASSVNSTTERVLHFLSGTSTISGVTIRYGGTVGNGSGGGVVVDGFNGANTNVTLNSVTISDNTSATFGGGIVVINNGTLMINDSTITNNFAGGGGAGIYTNGTATINNTTVSSNQAVSNASSGVFGGGISAIGSLTLNNSLVENNTVTATASSAPANGGGLSINAVATLNDSSVINNVATSTTNGVSNGGGIYTAASVLTLNRTYISTNTANRGGGISAEGIIINQSAIVNNTGTVFGGGIFIFGGGSFINNSTIAENKTNGPGGGLININGVGVPLSRVDVNFSTIARNVSDQDNTGNGSGGGIFNSNNPGSSSFINLKNSVVADNTVGTGSTNSDISGVITSQGYNHVETVGGATFTATTGDVTGSDPALGLLITNSSNSFFIPAANSPLIDSIPNGTSGCGAAPFDIDQRGMSRPVDSNRDMTAACEKGAVEIAAPTAATVTISGRVMTPNGRGLMNAEVILIETNGTIRYARTTAFGYFRFPELEAGSTVIISVNSKRYLFAPQVISLTEDLTDVNFTGQPRQTEIFGSR